MTHSQHSLRIELSRFENKAAEQQAALLRAQEEHSLLRSRDQRELARLRQEEQRLLQICEERQQMLDRLKRHPLIGPVLKGRRWLKHTIGSVRS